MIMRLVGMVDMIRADKPLKTALNPSSEYNVLAVSMMDVPPSIWKLNMEQSFSKFIPRKYVLDSPFI